MCEFNLSDTLKPRGFSTYFIPVYKYTIQFEKNELRSKTDIYGNFKGKNMLMELVSYFLNKVTTLIQNDESDLTPPKTIEQLFSDEVNNGDIKSLLDFYGNLFSDKEVQLIFEKGSADEVRNFLKHHNCDSKPFLTNTFIQTLITEKGCTALDVILENPRSWEFFSFRYHENLPVQTNMRSVLAELDGNNIEIFQILLKHWGQYLDKNEIYSLIAENLTLGNEERALILLTKYCQHFNVVEISRFFSTNVFSSNVDPKKAIINSEIYHFFNNVFLKSIKDENVYFSRRFLFDEDISTERRSIISRINVLIFTPEEYPHVAAYFKVHKVICDYEESLSRTASYERAARASKISALYRLATEISKNENLYLPVSVIVDQIPSEDKIILDTLGQPSESICNRLLSSLSAFSSDTKKDFEVRNEGDNVSKGRVGYSQF
jgi:hypothetical protein